jgi:uncharacterized membrane protein
MQAKELGYTCVPSFKIKKLTHMKRILLISTGFTLLLFAVRVMVTQSFYFFFIPWNLFLAWLPLFFISRLKGEEKSMKNIAFLMLWMLFFPNAPYVITDLFHLENRPPVPMYFDLLILFSAAWNGLLMGLLSVKKLEDWLLQTYHVRTVRLIIIGCFFLCGFGIYLGRFERFNSWHIVTQPADLFTDIFYRFANPFDHLRTWAVTILFGVVLFFFYETLKAFQFSSNTIKK